MSLRAAAAGVVVARALGLASAFAFSVVVAHRFGSDRATDVAFAALALPQAMLVMIATFVPPVFTSTFKSLEVTRGPEEAWAFGRSAPKVAAVVAGALAAVGIAASPLVARVVAGGYTEGEMARVARYMQFAFAIVLFGGVASTLKGILNASGSLGIPSLETFVMNVAAIGTILATAVRWREFSIVAGVTAGALAKVILMFPSYVCGRRGGRGRWIHPALKGLAGPVGLYGLLFVLQVAVSRALAARVEGEGILSYVTYAEKIFSAPQDLFIVSIGVVLLPTLAQRAALGDLAEVRRLAGLGLRLTVFLGIPAAVGLAVLAEPIVGLVYQHGRFDAHDTRETATTLRAFAPALAFSGHLILYQGFFALQAARPILVSGAVMLAGNLVLGLLWVGPWRQGGLALAYSVSYIAGFAVSMALFAARVGWPDLRALASAAVRTGACAGLMAAVLWGTERAFPLPVLARVALGAAVFALASRFACAAEWRLLRRGSGASPEPIPPT